MRRPLRVFGLALHEIAAILTSAFASAYALAVFEIARLRSDRDLGPTLALGTTLGWPSGPFARVFLPAFAFTLVVGVYAARGPVAVLGRRSIGPAARALVAHAPLFLLPWVLGQTDVHRRPPLAALCMAASVALCAWFASADRPVEATSEHGGDARSPDAPDVTTTDAASTRSRWQRVRPHAPMLAILVGHLALFSFLSIQRDRALWSATVDLGIFKEALWNTLHGRPLYSHTVGYSFLGEHFSPILFLLVPIYAIAPFSATLLVTQTLAISASGWPIYRLALRAGLSRRLATIVATSMLIAPTMQHSMMYDFHMDLLGVPALAWVILAAEERRFIVMGLAAAWLCAVKEDAFIALSGVAVAMYLGDPKRRKLAPALLALVSIVYCAVAMFYLIKRFGPPPGVPEYMAGQGPPLRYKFLRNFRHLQGPHGILRTLFGMPARWVLYALTDARLTTLCVLFAPLLFAPLRTGRGIALLAPLGIIALADNPEVVELRYHYGAIHHPITYAAGVLGMAAWIAARSPERRVALDRALQLAVVTGTLVVATTHHASWAADSNTHDSRRVTARSTRVRNMALRVPPREPASVSSFGGPLFSNRPRVWLFPMGLDQADWVYVDTQRPGWPARPDHRDGAVISLLRSQQWGAMAWTDGAIVLARGADTSRNRRAIRDVFLHRRYEVEGTEQTDFTNCIEADRDASDGYARVVRPTERRSGMWVIFGPFIRLPDGHWRVTWRIRAERTSFEGDIGAVDVFSIGRTIIGHAIEPDDVAGGRWRNVSLEFDSTGLGELEFRLRTERAWVLGADVISVEPLDGDDVMLQRLAIP